MAKRKIHWYWGCGWGRAYSHDISAIRFASDSSKNPDWFCVTCATKSRLALAKESAPKPETLVPAVSWPEPRPIGEAPKDDAEIMGWCPGYGWRHLYLDLVDAWVAVGTPHQYQPTHFLPLPPEVK